MQRIFLTILTILIFQLTCLGASSCKNYIQKYKKWAIEEMKRTGIPASITLAQGILESNCGKSYLAKAGKNHFGIKCKRGWRGKAVYKDDDAPNECFRKYNSVHESYKDHSNFLMINKRYTFLFSYKTTDYKAWAYGLKRAGYATAKDYAHKLIKIIENEKLHRFDRDIKRKIKMAQLKQARKIKLPRNAKYDISLEKQNNYPRVTLQNNGVKYIIVKRGDTFYGLKKELGIKRRKFLKYNDLNKRYRLKSGDRLFIQKKKNKHKKFGKYYFTKGYESLYSISQQFALKLKVLSKHNPAIPVYENLKAGHKVRLR